MPTDGETLKEEDEFISFEYFIIKHTFQTLPIFSYFTYLNIYFFSFKNFYRDLIFYIKMNIGFPKIY